MYEDDSTSVRPEEMVELLEELTLSDPCEASTTDPKQEFLTVDVMGSISPADASRQAGAPTPLRLIGLAPRQLTAELDRPLGVGDLFQVDFGAEFTFGSRDAALMRCTACAENDVDRSDSRPSDTFRVFLRPIVAAIDIRRALSGK